MSKPTLQQVNEVMAEIWPSQQYQLFTNTKNQLYIKNEVGKTMSARLRFDRNWLASDRYGNLGMGGTLNGAVAQLICWYRGFPHLPISCFKHWTTIGLGQDHADRLIEFMEKYDFDANTNCVLCGNKPQGGLDWWVMDKKIGPACWLGKCQKS